ncbi:uncharacterized protein [Fopius arisanus]|uniref:RAP domain-containing protein n=1 Tax=Fopius arisanus TaxID=64838 RepID=A0A9R1TKM1_9HYME|nr:PREDICTED: uncharacterized protein LOC105271377 [Fopius arisanus]
MWKRLIPCKYLLKPLSISSFAPSTLLLQEGPWILEAPLLIPLTSDLSKFPVTPRKSLPLPKPPQAPEKSTVPPEILVKIDGVTFLEAPEANAKRLQKRIEINTEDGTAILFGAPSPSSPQKSSLCRLEDVPLNVRCRVYLQILSRILQSENSLIYHEEFSTYLYDQYRSTRNELLQDVVDTISSLQEDDLLLEGLALLSKDRMSPPRNPYRDKLVDESLTRVTAGEFQLEKIIKLIKTISNYHDRRYREAIDLLWSGIEAKQHEITSRNFLSLMKILDYFGESQKVVKIICEKKLQEFWRELNASEVGEILRVFQDSLSSPIVFECLEKWSRRGLTSPAGEEDVINFVKALISTGVYSSHFETALQELLEKRKDPSPVLVSSIMTYCQNLRIRNPVILENCAGYLAKKGLEIPENILASIFVPFGYLNYNVGGTFWRDLEKILEKKLSKMSPNDAINVLLSCAYLQKFSIQFSSKIFKSRLMRRIKSREVLKQRMKLLDKSLAIEYQDYVQHFEEDKLEKSVALRSKLRRVLNLIYPKLVTICGEEVISKSVVNEGRRTAVLIHLPEDYCRGTDVLIGPKAMRIRHLRKMGMQVVTLDYSQILNWCGEDEGLEEYLRERFKRPEEPF